MRDMLLYALFTITLFIAARARTNKWKMPTIVSKMEDASGNTKTFIEFIQKLYSATECV